MRFFRFCSVAGYSLHFSAERRIFLPLLSPVCGVLHTGSPVFLSPHRHLYTDVRTVPVYFSVPGSACSTRLSVPRESFLLLPADTGCRCRFLSSYRYLRLLLLHGSLPLLCRHSNRDKSFPRLLPSQKSALHQIPVHRGEYPASVFCCP